MSSLKRRVSDLERIATAQRTTPDETVEQTRARYRGYLQAAFGADFDLALSLGATDETR